MSEMLFKPEHIEMIRRGEKTATRRDWKRLMVKIGGVYSAKTRLFQPNSECDVFVRVVKLYRQPLGEMTEEDALKEGGYTIEEFIRVWKDINGWWDPYHVVWVVEFEKVPK